MFHHREAFVGRFQSRVSLAGRGGLLGGFGGHGGLGGSGTAFEKGDRAIADITRKSLRARSEDATRAMESFLTAFNDTLERRTSGPWERQFNEIVATTYAALEEASFRGKTEAVVTLLSVEQLAMLPWLIHVFPSDGVAPRTDDPWMLYKLTPSSSRSDRRSGGAAHDDTSRLHSTEALLDDELWPKTKRAAFTTLLRVFTDRLVAHLRAHELDVEVIEDSAACAESASADSGTPLTNPTLRVRW